MGLPCPSLVGSADQFSQRFYIIYNVVFRKSQPIKTPTFIILKRFDTSRFNLGISLVCFGNFDFEVNLVPFWTKGYEIEWPPIL